MNLFKKIIPFMALFLAACGTSNTEEGTTESLDVVTTFYPMYNFTENSKGLLRKKKIQMYLFFRKREIKIAF